MLKKAVSGTRRPSLRNSNFPSSHGVPTVNKPSNKPVILIIHGAYFTPNAWEPFINTLSEAGFEAHCPRLPTCGDKSEPTGTFKDYRPATATLQDDVKAVRKKAIELAAAERSIVILAHSYGGIVTADAIDGELCAHFRPPNTGGVVHLILLNAWLPLKGSSIRDCLKIYGPKSSCDIGSNEDGTVFIKNAPDVFYNDVRPLIRAEELATANVTHNWSATGHGIRSTPWVKVSTTYVQCKQDKAIWPELQEDMIEAAISKGGAKGLRTETLDAGHCPFLSMPETFVSMIEEITAGV